MAQPIARPFGPGFDGPPLELRAMSPRVYEYLLMLHQVIFGTLEEPQGILDQDNINAFDLIVDHSRAIHLDADDHPQYLSNERHAALTGNPHSMTPADILADEPHWNAGYLRGNTVGDELPDEGDVLTWDADDEVWVPVAPTVLAGTIVKSTQVVVSPPAGTGIYIATGVVPGGVLIMGILARNIFAVSGITGFSVGSESTVGAWGTCGVTADAVSSLSGFVVNNPRYSDAGGEDLTIVPAGGNWPAGTAIELTIHYWDAT